MGATQRLKPVKKNDELLKSIFEDNFPDFLQFMYADAEKIFDLDRSQRRSATYSYTVFRTSLEFRYLSYQIFDHSEEELLGMDNIFAYIVLACQKSLQENKMPEEELAEQRSLIARTLIQTNRYSKDRIMSFLVFLKSFLFIRDKEINSKFPL